jgi:hypothetical protein
LGFSAALALYNSGRGIHLHLFFASGLPLSNPTTTDAMDSIPPAELEILKGQTKGPATLITVIIFTSLALLVVLLRLVTRFLIVRNAGAEDYTIAVAMVGFLSRPPCGHVLILADFIHCDERVLDRRYGCCML